MAVLNLPEGVSIRDQLDPELTNVGAIISEALKYIFPFSGLILFFMLLASGFQLLTAAGNEESIKKASQKITYAVIGFVVIFISFWLIKLLETILGVNILSIGGGSGVEDPSLPMGPAPEEY